MRRTKLKPGHNPEHYPCKNPKCERSTPLDLKSYGMDLGSDVPEDRIHRVSESHMPGFVLLCPQCAHYTVVTRYREAPQ
jgi:hypothetical protein